MTIRRFLLSIATILIPLSTAQAARVPFVGCASDGQTGPNDPPSGDAIDVEGGEGLSYYKDGFLGVLAPRGWSCFGTYGSSGSTLLVAPMPLNSAIVFAEQWKGIVGDGIQVSQNLGDTSGRFAAAAVAARVFPAKRDYVQRVINEGFLPASEFPIGPFPGDQLTYKSELIVEYETPTRTAGLGTRSRLQTNEDAIRGVAMFVDDETGVFQLSARLPTDARRLWPIVTRKFESEHAP